MQGFLLNTMIWIVNNYLSFIKLISLFSMSIITLWNNLLIITIKRRVTQSSKYIFINIEIKIFIKLHNTSYWIASDLLILHSLPVQWSWQLHFPLSTSKSPWEEQSGRHCINTEFLRSQFRPIHPISQIHCAFWQIPWPEHFLS